METITFRTKIRYRFGPVYVPIVRKQLLAPGPVFIEDEETGKPVLVDIKQSHIDRWVNGSRQMLKAGLSIPVPYEHQSLKPMTEGERRAGQVKNNAGFVKDFVRVSGKTYVDLDIPDEKEAAKLGKTIKYVSPDIEPRIVDGRGRVWENIISHVALTNRPRWMDQEPFGTDGADLLGRLGGGNKLEPRQFSLSKPLRLSLATALVRKGGAWRWADPTALQTALKLSIEGDMADEPEKKEEEEVVAEVPEPTPVVEPEPKSADNIGPVLAACSAMLAKCGIKVPDGTSDPVEYIRQLQTSLIAHEHAREHYGVDENKPGEEEEPEAVEEPVASDSVTEEPHTMMMSLTKISDPVAKKMAERQATALKTGIAANIKELVESAVISPAEAKQLEGQMRSLQFSLNTNTGEVECGLAGRVLAMVSKGAKRKKPFTERAIDGAAEEPQPTDESVQLSMGAKEAEPEVDKEMIEMAEQYAK